MVPEFIATNGTLFCFLVLSIERVFGCRHFRVLNSQETCNARNWRGVAYGFRQHSGRLSLYKDVFIALGPVQDNFFSKIVLRCILQKWYHAFFRHMFFSRFPPFLRFPCFQTFDPKRFQRLFQHLSAWQVWIRSASWISKKSMRSWNRCWLCKCEQFFCVLVGRSSNDIARFNRSCKCCQVAMRLIDMDPISQLQNLCMASCRCEVAGPLLG